MNCHCIPCAYHYFTQGRIEMSENCGELFWPENCDHSFSLKHWDFQYSISSRSVNVDLHSRAHLSQGEEFDKNITVPMESGGFDVIFLQSSKPHIIPYVFFTQGLYNDKCINAASEKWCLLNSATGLIWRRCHLDRLAAMSTEWWCVQIMLRWTIHLQLSRSERMNTVDLPSNQEHYSLSDAVECSQLVHCWRYSLCYLTFMAKPRWVIFIPYPNSRTQSNLIKCRCYGWGLAAAETPSGQFTIHKYALCSGQSILGVADWQLIVLGLFNSHFFSQKQAKVIFTPGVQGFVIQF